MMYKNGLDISKLYIFPNIISIPANNDLLDLWSNLWCNNSKSIFFLDGNLFVFDISIIFPKNTWFLCALCGKVTAFFFW